MLAGRLRGDTQSTTRRRSPSRDVPFGTFNVRDSLYAETVMGSQDVKAESAAPDIERQRAAAEAERESAEQARAEAEAVRAAAERARLTAEQERAEAEATRVKSIAEVGATAYGLTAILDEMKVVETMRRARRTMKDPDDPKTH